jgi:hypothetical protein
MASRRLDEWLSAQRIADGTALAPVPRSEREGAVEDALPPGEQGGIGMWPPQPHGCPHLVWADGAQGAGWAGKGVADRPQRPRYEHHKGYQS